MNGEAGKGDSPRPKAVSEEEYAQKYQNIFGEQIPWWNTKKHQEWVKQIEKEKDELDKHLR